MYLGVCAKAYFQFLLKYRTVPARMVRVCVTWIHQMNPGNH